MFGWKFNEWLGLIVLLIILGIFAYMVVNRLELNTAVTGALVSGFTIVLQFFFRKAQTETGNGSITPPA